MKKEKKIIYYKDELNDEFSKIKIIPKKIDGDYKYIHHNFLLEIFSFILQNILSMPVKVLYSKLKFKIKYIGKEKIKKYTRTGYFIYVNHTQVFADTFIPSIPIYPKRNFFIVNPENVSMRNTGELVKLLGAIPIPTEKSGMKNFLQTIEYRIKKNQSITIYPEAHIWPYYTKIRPFKDVSFKYPVKLEVPVFCMTNTYQKIEKNKFRIVTYIDGPFFPNKTLHHKQQQRELRDCVYNCMVDRSNNSNFEMIKYKFLGRNFGDTPKNSNEKT